MPNSSSTIAQITSSGRNLQTKSERIRIGDLLDAHPGSSDLAQISGLYVHIPFCFHKCHYCDFYSIVDSQDRQEAFVDRLIGELAASIASASVASHSIPFISRRSNAGTTPGTCIAAWTFFALRESGISIST
jgi:coproporphyrinogen III oxidase-like Fe-S oxidoreductase